MFVPVKPFLPRVIIVGKARAYLSRACLGARNFKARLIGSLHGLSANARLGWFCQLKYTRLMVD